MERRNIERINQLTQLSRQRELTAAEQEERAQLRTAYLKAFRAQMRGQLENTVVEYPDGSRVPFREAGKKQGK